MELRPRLAFSFLLAALVGFSCGRAEAQPKNVPDVKLGLVLAKTNGNLVIQAVLGQAVYDAGLRPRQIIKQIDGRSTDDLSVEQAVEAVKGPVGSRLTLTIVKPGQSKPVEIEITRGPYITLKSVTDRVIEGGIGVIGIRSFEMDCGSKVATILESFRNKQLKGLVLDLRDNGGGYLQGTMAVANLLLDKKCVLWITKRNGREETEHSTPVHGWDGPIAVLVNEATASGAEILASALQLNGRAKVVGQRTSGHASISTRSATGSVVKIGEYYNSRRQAIDGHGVTPDIALDVNLSEDVTLSRATTVLK